MGYEISKAGKRRGNVLEVGTLNIHMLVQERSWYQIAVRGKIADRATVFSGMSVLGICKSKMQILKRKPL